MLAANRACSATGASPRLRSAQLLRRQEVGVFERAALEIARRERRKAVERQEIGGGAQLTVLRGRGAEGSLGEVAAQFRQPLRVGPLAVLRPPNGDGLEALAAKEGAAAAPPRMASVVRDGRVANAALPRWSDRRDAKVITESGAQLRLGHTARIAEHIARGLDSYRAIVD